MEKITYLLGAGASYNALPTYIRNDNDSYQISESDLIACTVRLEETQNDEIRKMFDPHNFLHRLIFFRNEFNIGKGNYQNKKQEAQDFLKDLNWLIHQLTLHVSIDTVAKKLFVTCSDDLDKLKLLISCFFVYEQRVKHFDQRYDTFIASFIEKSNNKKKEVEFSNDIRVITWNYDIQFEIAFKNYTSDDSINNIQQKLNTFPFVGLTENRQFIEDRFGIVRLNGVAGFQEDNFQNISQLIRETEKDEMTKLLDEIIYSYTVNIKRTNYHSNVFCYSWEKKEIAKKAMTYSKNILKNTEILIVIGYSFPFFNRQIDDELIKSLSPHIKKIYIQDPNGDEIKEMLSERYYDHHKKMEVIKNSRSFFIPTWQTRISSLPMVWN